MIFQPSQGFWGKLGLAARLIILSGLALLAGGAVQLYVTAQSEVANVRVDFAEYLEGELQSLEILLSEQVVIGDYSTIQQILDARVKHRDVREIRLIGKRGRHLEAADNLLPMRAPVWFAEWVALSGMEGRRDIVVGGQNYGQIVVRLTEVPTVNRIWRLFLVQSIILLAGLLFFGVVTAVLIRCGLAPLRDLIRQAEALGKGDYSARISMLGTPEMQVAAKSFNDMASRLEGLLTSLHEREARLHEALTERNSILDNAVVGIAFLKERRFAWVNQKFEEMFGYTREEIGERSTEIFYASPEDFRQLGEEAYVILARGGKYSSECLMKRKDDSLFWCLLSGKMVDRDDLSQGSIWILHDISTRRVAEENLKHLNETLEQRVFDEAAKNRDKDHLMIQQSRLAAMGEMIGNIAHQWRQPLNALGLLLANIKDAHDFNEMDDAFIEKATATGNALVQKMSTTIDDFRNFFRPNREKLPFSLNKAIHEALVMIEANFGNHHITVDWREGEDVAVPGFQNEYSQVLLNILGNARDAILSRKVAQGRVEIRLRHDEKQATVTIRDNGGGIPLDALGKIFDPYFTTREQGTGIGLYMSKMIVESNMGGRIEARNVDGGAEFAIVTPIGDKLK